MFRKGKALGEMGFFEKAQAVLEDLKKKNPPGAQTRIDQRVLFSGWDKPDVNGFFSDATGVDKELARLRAIDNARERAHRESLRGTLLIPPDHPLVGVKKLVCVFISQDSSRNPMQSLARSRRHDATLPCAPLIFMSFIPPRVYAFRIGFHGNSQSCDQPFDANQNSCGVG